ncbi:ribonuclease HI [Acidaminococcus sp. LBK-2]|uniref:ribonuclease HI n=1 Tax=Acidaminococcus sp. LBK-2 TaxID=3456956 RepID=UPI003FA45787
MAAKKSYAVRKGRKIGLFGTWAECQEQVTGFPGARFKGFASQEEAEAWLQGDDAAGNKPTVPCPGTAAGKKAAREQAAQEGNLEEEDYVIYTDGSCLRNPDGPGGWAFVAEKTATGEVTERSGGEPSTTNNRMELTAAIEALAFAPEGARVALYTDSQYLKNGITQWVAGWKRRGWKKADGNPVLNQGLWMELDRLYGSHTVTFHWVKGHVGISLNERCDELAKQEALKAK